MGIINALQENTTVQANNISDSDADIKSNLGDSAETGFDLDTEMGDEFLLHWNKNVSFAGFNSKSKFTTIFENTNMRNANAQPIRLDVQVVFNSVSSTMKS